MPKTKQSPAAHGSAGGTMAGRANTYWYHAACRVYVYFELTQPKAKDNKRYALIRDFLNRKGVRNKFGKPLGIDAVKDAIKTKKKATRDALKKCYGDQVDGLIDFELTRELEGAIEADILPTGERVPWNDLGPIAADLQRLLDSDGNPSEREFERKRRYQSIAQKAVLRLRSVISAAEYEWSVVQEASQAAGVKVADFPAEELIRAAFPPVEK